MKKRNIIWLGLILAVFCFMAKAIYSMLDWEIRHMSFENLS